MGVQVRCVKVRYVRIQFRATASIVASETYNKIPQSSHLSHTCFFDRPIIYQASSERLATSEAAAKESLSVKVMNRLRFEYSSFLKLLARCA